MRGSGRQIGILPTATAMPYYGLRKMSPTTGVFVGTSKRSYEIAIAQAFGASGSGGLAGRGCWRATCWGDTAQAVVCSGGFRIAPALTEHPGRNYSQNA